MQRNRTDRATFLLSARKSGYRLHRRNEWSYILKQESPTFGKVTFNFYWNKSNFRYTVQTTIDHPKKGGNQLNRKGLTLEQAIKLLANPREHTGKGYYFTK